MVGSYCTPDIPFRLDPENQDTNARKHGHCDLIWNMPKNNFYTFHYPTQQTPKQGLWQQKNSQLSWTISGTTLYPRHGGIFQNKSLKCHPFLLLIPCPTHQILQPSVSATPDIQEKQTPTSPTNTPSPSTLSPPLLTPHIPLWDHGLWTRTLTHLHHSPQKPLLRQTMQ
jgi:hypothetical protein